MDDTAMAGEPILQTALTLLKYGREAELEAVLRPLLQMLAQTITPQKARNWLDTIRIYVMSVNPGIGEQELNEMIDEFWPIKPEPGSIADQLLKKGEAIGEERGETNGEARGKTLEKMNTVRILQSILGVPQSSDEELSGMNLEQLQTTIESMQQQIMQRPG